MSISALTISISDVLAISLNIIYDVGFILFALFSMARVTFQVLGLHDMFGQAVPH